MAALDELLARIDDASLRGAIEAELAPLRGERELGLVFERHLPEKVRLPGLAVQRGATVELRAERNAPTWQVLKISAGQATIVRRGNDDAPITETHPVAGLVVVREFGQPIHPGLRSVGRIERGGDKPFHTVINAENYHALETLLYTCEGKADVIYIDPPYNTGARDWKYNNDYVDGNDGYRHSKWLSFMEKRLLLAKRLLNPEDSVLIVTIDEKEVHRLGMLLEQVFPEARAQLVTIVINPLGQARKQELARVEEYAHFLFLGSAEPANSPDDLLAETAAGRGPTKVRWERLIRGGTNAARADRPNLFYPVFVEPKGGIVGVGESLGRETDRRTVLAPEGAIAVWPLSTSGAEGRWRVGPKALRDLVEAGHAKVGAYDRKNDRYSLLYLGRAQVARIASGEIRVTGKDVHGVVVLEGGSATNLLTAKTVWNRLSHRAGENGSALLKKFLPARTFPFPKSLYAVEDAVRIAVANKPDALVIDFFGGSGTTTHAVMRLNRQDGGRRRSVLVTNNEIGPDAEKKLTEQGKAAGDPEWEALGIFEHITKPRIEAAVTGVTHDGKPVVGDYKFVDEFPMAEGFDENVEFFTLSYEDPDRVRLGAAFEAVAPLLWLMAGAAGPRIDSVSGSWSLPDGGRYGVLFDADGWPDFADAVKAAEAVSHAFVVTDSDAVFQRVVAELPDTVTPVRLYESYLRSFAINTGASS